MPFSQRDIALIAVGAAFGLLVLWVAWNETGDHGPPRYENEGNPNLSLVIDRLNTGDHYFHPDYCVPGQTVKFTPHRYPVTNGPNITALIHHGMTPLTLPSPHDNDWRVNAPAEQAW